MRKYIHHQFIPILYTFLALSFFFSTCKSKPVPQIPETAPLSLPSASLIFTDVEAKDPTHLILSFKLETKIPSALLSQGKIESWRVNIDGQNASYAFNLDYPQGNFVNSSIPLKLNMDIDSLAEKGLAPKDDYSITLITEIGFTSDSAESVKFDVSGIAEFPGVQAPEFLITSIAIIKAELVNTRFRVGMKIDNPNPYPVELSTFSYKLYGNGMFWADGLEKNIIRISGNSSVSGNLFMMMNFIDMDRNLLNQIINLVNVNYRFTGEAQVSTGVEYLPVFSTDFNLSGYSVVLEN